MTSSRLVLNSLHMFSTPFCSNSAIDEVSPSAPASTAPTNMATNSGHVTIFECTVCQRRFASKKYLSMHVALHKMATSGTGCDVIDDDALASCRQQRSVLIGSSAGGRHGNGSTQNHHQHQQQQQQWACPVCGKTFAQNSNFRNHVRTHSDERPYVCLVCFIGFKERYHLKKHALFKHSGELREQCRQCGKRFKDLTAVRAHERTHSDQRPYQCDRCNKTFKTSECLWHHENRSKTCGRLVGDVTPGRRRHLAVGGSGGRSRDKRAAIAASTSSSETVKVEKAITTTVLDLGNDLDFDIDLEDDLGNDLDSGDFVHFNTCGLPWPPMDEQFEYGDVMPDMAPTRDYFTACQVAPSSQGGKDISYEREPYFDAVAGDNCDGKTIEFQFTSCSRQSRQLATPVGQFYIADDDLSSSPEVGRIQSAVTTSYSGVRHAMASATALPGVQVAACPSLPTAIVTPIQREVRAGETATGTGKGKCQLPPFETFVPPRKSTSGTVAREGAHSCWRPQQQCPTVTRCLMQPACPGSPRLPGVQHVFPSPPCQQQKHRLSQVMQYGDFPMTMAYNDTELFLDI